MSSLAANNTAAADCKLSEGQSLWAHLVEVLGNIFPRKTAVNLAHVSGLKERAAYAFLAGQSALSSDAIVALLRSEIGKEVLDALMQNAAPRWYSEFSLMWDEAQLEAKRQELQERRKALREKP